MRVIVAVIVIVGFFGTAMRAAAQMSSTNYEIRWDTVGAGGDNVSSSPSYILRDTVGNAGVGDGSSASYGLRAGYRQGVYDSFIEFSLFSQASAVVSATALVGTTVTCTTGSFSVGDMVAVVQDRGVSQVSAIGQIASIGAGSVTLDALRDGGIAPVIDGSSDYVYLLDGTSADFGTLTESTVRTAVVGMEVSTDADAGYVVQIVSDGSLRNGSETIDAVADGSVTAGSEEYGARSSDTSLAGSTFDSSDTAITTTFQDIADRASAAHKDRNFLTLKASIDGETAPGSYGQRLTLVVSGNY
jgi:hypothetical protein